MRWFKSLAVLMVLLVVSSCSTDNLEKMIPADAIGAISLDVPAILKETNLIDDGNIVLPKSLQQVVDDNDSSPLCIMLNDLPQMGIDTGQKAYIFFTDKTFARVLIAALDDSDKARRTLSMRVGGDFQKLENMDCMYVKDNFYVIHDKVLFIATVNKSMEASRLAKAAQAILSKSAASMADVKAVSEVLHHDDADVNAWIQGKGLKAILGKSEVYRELSQKMPLLAIFTESDIDAFVCHLDLDKEQVQLQADIQAAQDSEYAQLLNTTLSKPGDDVLKAIPNSMDYIFTLSVKGDNFVKLKQIQQLLTMFGKIPYIGRIDLAKILSTIDGPFTIGLARDPHLEGEWNVVLAARSTDPQSVVDQISSFANAMGQAPELYEGEYIYQYDNKMIRIGITDGILYLKMLDYEQTEGYAYEMKPVREFFDNAVVGLFAQTRTDSITGYFDFGLQDIFKGNGHFYTSQPGANASLEFLRALCAVKTADAFGNEDDDSDFSSFMSGAIDKLQPME